MTNILKLSSLFFAVRKPMIIQRPLTTTYLLYKEKKKITPKLEKKIKSEKVNWQDKQKFFQKSEHHEDRDEIPNSNDYYEECPVCCSNLRETNARCNYCIDSLYFPQK